MQTPAAVAFRFDKANHQYIDAETGAELAHITGLLEAAGWIDTTFMNDEGRRRGSAVHDLTAHFDLGALDLESCQSEYKGYLRAHEKAMGILRPEILAVEEPLVSVQQPRYGGRPDRVVRLDGVYGVLEIKSGGRERAHSIQTAAQAILVSAQARLPPTAIARYALYLRSNGSFRFEEHRDRGDYDIFYDILRNHSGVPTC